VTICSNHKKGKTLHQTTLQIISGRGALGGKKKHSQQKIIKAFFKNQ
jgi:hypothetical protein